MKRSITVQEHVDEGGHVRNGNNSVTVHVAVGRNIPATQQLVNDIGHIVDSDASVTIDVARASTDKRHDVRELAPLPCCSISLD